MCSSSSATLGSRKSEARDAAKAALRRLSEATMAQESAAITDHLHSAGLVDAARRMAIYVHCAKLREVDTTAVLAEALERRDARVYVPRVQDKDANMHFLHITSMENDLVAVPPYGIREPTPTEPTTGLPREDVSHVSAPIELVVMPGLAFDSSGRRLGRGGGYYDKFIDVCRRRAEENSWPSPLLVALAFRAQMMDQVPVDNLDQPVDIIVTADGVMCCSERAKGMR
jgi:5-formyltetrahydrofolate cyclo-ligase